MKKLTRKRSDRMIVGVCSGVADYFNLDAAAIRLAWIIFACLGGSGIVAYILAAIVIPEE